MLGNVQIAAMDKEALADTYKRCSLKEELVLAFVNDFK